jgi:hypothetical protein
VYVSVLVPHSIELHLEAFTRGLPQQHAKWDSSCRTAPMKIFNLNYTAKSHPIASKDLIAASHYSHISKCLTFSLFRSRDTVVITNTATGRTDTDTANCIFHELIVLQISILS